MSTDPSGWSSWPMTRRIQEGALSWARVVIADLDDGGEAALIRSLLEGLGLAVELYGIGQPRHLAALLQGQALGSRPDYLVLTGHGEDGAVLLPDAPALADAQPFRFRMTPADVHQCFRLLDVTVIHLGCTSGSPQMADAYLAGGASAFVGPSGYPEGAEAALLVHLLFYRLAQGDDLQAAFDPVTQFCSPSSGWRLYRSPG